MPSTARAVPISESSRRRRIGTARPRSPSSELAVTASKRPRSKRSKKRISLALQGGGSHGAFTWGVLEALLEDGRFEIAGISGNSAGGMNAAAMLQGLIRGGAAGAIESLEDF